LTKPAFCLAGLLACFAAAPTIAHHSFAMFDQTRQVNMSGIIRHFAFANPHALFHVAIANDRGQTSTWTLEGGSVQQLASMGWSSQSFRVGDRVEVSFHPMKDGSHRGQLLNIRTAN
jgi:hypothetical protein